MSRFAVLASQSVMAASLVAWAPSAHAQAADRQTCVSTYEQAQQHQKGGRLVKALEAFNQCAQDNCPSVVRQQCALALPELEQSVPSVVFDASDADGNQVIDVRVDVDGALAASRLDGRAVSLDPGRHVVRFEAPGGRVVEQTIVMLEGQRRRPVRAQFGPGDEASGDEQRPYGVVPWIVAGAGVTVAVVGLVVFVVGKNEIADAEESCPSRACDNQALVDEGNAGRSKSIAGKVLLGAGGALVAGGLIWQLAGNRAPASPAVSLSVRPSGSVLRVSAKF
jgi:hypothetical protein